MGNSIALLCIGILCISLGLSNRKGNLASLHCYHRKRVTEENRVPFGKLVGLGMIIIGVAALVSSGASYTANLLQQAVYATISEGVLIAGVVIGLGIQFYAMIKYNQGIF